MKRPHHSPKSDEKLVAEARATFDWLACEAFGFMHQKELAVFLYCLAKTVDRLHAAHARRRVSQAEVTRRLARRVIAYGEALYQARVGAA